MTLKQFGEKLATILERVTMALIMVVGLLGLFNIIPIHAALISILGSLGVGALAALYIGTH